MSTASPANFLLYGKEEQLSKDIREIGGQAVWSVTSAKPGNGVELLRDGKIDSYWQSDGTQPHLVNMQFQKKMLIKELHLYLDFKLDESYTPSKIAVRAGNSFYDLKEIKEIELEEPHGWIGIPLQMESSGECLKALLLQIAVLTNHQNGRDTHVRQIRVYGPRTDPIRALGYEEGGAKASPSGPFKKKCLILAIIETDPRTNRTESLGRVVMDLAEFASVNTENCREFPVACSKTIQAAVGEPSLGVTIRSAWKGAAGPGSNGSFASSLSSDATGATLTSQLSSLVKNQPSAPATIQGGLTGDQMDDLRAFARLRTINESESEYRHFTSSKSEAVVSVLPKPVEGPSNGAAPGGHYDEDGFMVDSDEDVDKEKSRVEAVPMKGKSRISSWLESSIEQEVRNLGIHDDATPSISSRASGESDNHKDGSEQPVVGAMATSPLAKDEEVLVRRQDALVTAKDSTTTSKEEVKVQVHDRRFARSPDSSQESTPRPGSNHVKNDVPAAEVSSATQERGSMMRKKEEKVVSANGMNGKGGVAARTQVPRRWRRVNEGDNLAGKGVVAPATATPFSLGTTELQQQEDQDSRSQENVRSDLDLHIQLRNAAFLEVSVYLARSGRSQLRARNAHAPARRIIRTLAALGPDNGGALLKDAFKAVNAMVDGCGTDIYGMAFWWSNCVQMRFLLPHIGSGGSHGSAPWKNSISASEGNSTIRGILESLLQLEKHIFDRIQQYLWWKILIPKVADQGRLSRGSQGRKRDGNASVHQWLDALQSMNDMFLMSPNGTGNDGHVTLLRQQVLQTCCKTIDAILFKELMAAHGGEQVLVHQFSGLANDAFSVPSLDDSVLPFKRSQFTFGEGMQIKMAVTRWAEWAFEVDIREKDAGSKPGQNLFPLLKATADLLMMPKELLTDESVREDAFAALSTRTICFLLRHFEPDDFAPDTLDPSVLKNLEAILQTHKYTSQKVALEYDPPAVQEKKVPNFTDPSLPDDPITYEFDDVSEDDFESLSSIYGGKEKPSRFDLLKELWVERRERRRRGSR